MEAVRAPDLVGLSFIAARELATACRVVLANADPDGPPISALAWDEHRHVFRDAVIDRQEPEPGFEFAEPWSAVTVWLTNVRGSGGPVGESLPLQPEPPLSTLNSQAEPPADEDLLDLGGGR